MNLAVCHQKNSARFLPALVRSVGDLVDQIFILDDGSTDNSQDVLVELSKRYPLVWESYRTGPSGYNEKNIRNYLYQRAIEKFGWPEWFVYLDGDEYLSEFLRSFLKEAFTEVPPYEYIETGWQHLVSEGTSLRQALNRRNGRVCRIWNTTSVSPDDLVFSNLIGKDQDYPFHIATIPDSLRKNRKAEKKKILAPVNHLGFWDETELERKREYHEVLFTANRTLKPYHGDLRLIKEPLCSFPAVDMISPERFSYYEDLFGQGRFNLAVNWETTGNCFGPLVAGFDEGTWMVGYSHALRSSIFPLLTYRESLIIKDRSSVTYRCLENFCPQEYGEVLVPKDQEDIWRVLLSGLDLKINLSE